MTIESASHPSPLSEWDGANPQQPYYLEILGETTPLVDTSYSEVVALSEPPNAVQASTSAPIYEYWWTLGHPGHSNHRGGLLDRFDQHATLWERLCDRAARVYVYFPLGGGWRVKELAAAIKYMSPVAHEQSFLEKAAEDWQTVAPFVEGASKLAGVAGSAGVIAGATADKTAKLLDGIAQIKLGSVPQIKGFEWSATKVTFGSRDHGGVMQGVVWTLPKSMFEELGGRITGSLAVSFIPDNEQARDNVASHDPQPQKRAVLAHAVVYGPDDHEYWAPEQRSFIRLEIAPRLSRAG